MLHKEIKDDNGIVHYFTNDIKQERKTLFFCHGLTADHTMFEKQYAYFKTKYNLILVDLPLHGLSYPYNKFSYENCVEVMNNILIKEKINKVVLIGMSMGGYPCQFFANEYKDKTEGFISIDSTPLGLKYYSKSDIFFLKKVKPMAKLFSEHLLKVSMAKAIAYTKYSAEKMMEIYKSLNKDRMLDQLDIAYGYFIKENKDVDFDYPIMLILGECDNTGKVKAYNKAWSIDLNIKINYIEKSRHYSNGDNPLKVNKLIEDFVDTL